MLSSAGGDSITAIITPTLPHNASVVLVLHHPSGNIAVPQIINESEMPSLPNLSEPVFRLPPLPPDPLPQPLTWHVIVSHVAGESVAKDKTSGFKFKIAHPPIITRIFPDRLPSHSNQDLVYLLGRYLGNGTVIQDGRKLSSSRVISMSSSHISLRIFRTFRVTSFSRQVNISVISADKLESSIVHIIFDPHIPFLSTRVLNSFQSITEGQFTVPVSCGKWEPPTIAASLDLISDFTGVFNFSSRVDDASESNFTPLSYGSSSIVTLEGDGLFSESPQLAERSIAVLVSVDFNNSALQTVIIIGRHVVEGNIGLTVSEMLAGPSFIDSAVELRVSTSLLTCPQTEFDHVNFIWRINGDPTPAPLGNSVVVNSALAFTYSVDVRVVDNFGKILQTGAAHGSVGARTVPVFVVINGGCKSMTIQSGRDGFRVYAAIQAGFVPSTAYFSWECRQLPQRSGCTAALWPSPVGDVSEFYVSTKNVSSGTAVEYTVHVMNDGTSIASWNLVVKVVSDNLVLFPEASVRFYGNSDPGMPARTFTFQCFERLIFHWDRIVLSNGADGEIYFWLRGNNSESNVLEKHAEAVIGHDGYWMPSNRFGQFLGIDLFHLTSGHYTLFASVNGSSPDASSRSWELIILPCITVGVSEPSLLKGVANETVFHVSVFTKPVMQATYVVKLQRVGSPQLTYFNLQERIFMTTHQSSARDAGGTSYDVANNVIRSLKSGTTLSFIVPHTGLFYVAVDVYDISGSRHLSSVRANSTISVSSTLETKPVAYETMLTNVISQRDYLSLIHFLKTAPAGTILSDLIIRDVIVELQLFSSFHVPCVVTAASIVRSCANLISLMQASQNLTLAADLLLVVRRVVSSSLAHAAEDGELREQLQHFFATMIDVALVDISVEGISDNLSRYVNDVQRSASDLFSLSLSTGRECGSVQQAIVSPASTNLSDDYRLGVECTLGQIAALPPEPYLYEQCNSSTMGTISGDTLVMTFEQADALFTEMQSEIIRGGIVMTNFLRRATSLNNATVVGIPDSKRCYRTNLVLDLSKTKIYFTNFSVNRQSNSSFFCYGAGQIRTQNKSSPYGMAETIRVDDFKVHIGDQIVVFTEQSDSVSVQLLLNISTFNQCKQPQLTAQLSPIRVASIVSGLLIALVTGVVFVIVLFFVRRPPGRVHVNVSRDEGWNASMHSESFTTSSGESFQFTLGSAPQFLEGNATFSMENIRHGSAMAEDNDDRSFRRALSVTNGDVLALGDRNVEQLGSSHTGGIAGGNMLRPFVSQYSAGSVFGNTSLSYGSSNSTLPLSSTTTSSSADEYIHRTSGSGSDLEEDPEETLVLADEFGRDV